MKGINVINHFPLLFPLDLYQLKKLSIPWKIIYKEKEIKKSFYHPQFFFVNHFSNHRKKNPNKPQKPQIISWNANLSFQLLKIKILYHF
jgi:hypothetical protein